jgi:hypothetical protein
VDDAPGTVAAGGPSIPSRGPACRLGAGHDPTTASSSSSGNTGGEGGVLPPVGTARASVIEEYLSDASTGLVRRDTGFTQTALRSRLGLNYVAPPQVGGGYNSTFGPQLVGGIAALFGDQLNNQQVVAVVQAQGQIQDIGGQVQYINTRRRWNWGAGAAHVPIPYVTAGLRAGCERLQHQPEPDPRHLRPDPGHHAVPAQHVAALRVRRRRLAADGERADVHHLLRPFRQRVQPAARGRQRIGEPLNTFDATAASSATTRCSGSPRPSPARATASRPRSASATSGSRSSPPTTAGTCSCAP